ncbi:unnamed protein product [Dovyalis caffra]|uniref:Uncharacterized protein n=1 Tax=Dovyalis caffra TaxID=77055 RepID=A0AAV1QVE5_9ROSI|nr:unnamed protein product [Dovyalis caffra]
MEPGLHLETLRSLVPGTDKAFLVGVDYLEFRQIFQKIFKDGKEGLQVSICKQGEGTQIGYCKFKAT